MNLLSPSVIGPAWGLSELGLALVKRAKAGSALQDRSSLGRIWAVNLAAITLGIILAFHFPAGRLPQWVCSPQLGGGLFVAGLVLRWYAILYLGRFFTVNVAIATDHELIRTGPYHWVRHPSYSGLLLMILGFSLTMGNLASLLVIMVPCAGALLWRIGIEEAALKQAFGGQYEAYQDRTRRLIPFVY